MESLWKIRWYNMFKPSEIKLIELIINETINSALQSLIVIVLPFTYLYKIKKQFTHMIVIVKLMEYSGIVIVA